MNKRAMFKKFKASIKKTDVINADVLAATLAETVIENGCECAVFVRDSDEEYSARVIAMSPENSLHRQFWQYTETQVSALQNFSAM